VRAVTTVASHPKIHAMTEIYYREYYIQNTAETMCSHALDAQRAIWPAIESIARARSSWGSPVVVEGWAILSALFLRRGPARRGRLLASRRRADP
jgi:hypothetical protein